MPRTIPECPAIPGVYYRVRGEEQVRRSPLTVDIESIVDSMMLKDPEGYWGPQIDLPYPSLPHEVEDRVVDDDDDGNSSEPRFPLDDDNASEEDRRDEKEYYRQYEDMARLYDLRHKAHVAVREYLEAWRVARRAAHERAIEIV